MAGAAPDLRRRHGITQAVAQLGQTALGAEPGIWRARVGPDDEVQPTRQVVDDRELLGLEQLDVGGADATGLVHAGELALDVAHRLVAEIAGQAAAEARQPRAKRGLEARLISRDEVQRVAFVGLDHLAVGDDLAAQTRGTQQRARRQPDEGIAPEALTPHHRFQQEAVASAARELQVQRQRRLQVGEGLGDERNAVVAGRSQALELKFGDHGGVIQAGRTLWTGQAGGGAAGQGAGAGVRTTRDASGRSAQK